MKTHNFHFALVGLLCCVLNASTLSAQWKRDTSATINGRWMPNAFSGGDYGQYFGRPAFADLDNNGLLDLYIGSGSNIYVFKNSGTRTTPQYQLVANRLVDNAVLSSAAPTFCDIDGDGDLDLFIGYGSSGEFGGTVLFYRNIGSRSLPNFQFVADSFARVDAWDNSVPFFYDWDKDNDFDLIVGGGYGDLFFVRNIGSRTDARWDTVALNFFKVGNEPIRVGYKATPIVRDVNRDGKPDLLIGNDRGSLNYYQNISADTVRTPSFKLVTTAFAGVDFGWYDYTAAAIADITGDGIEDILLNEYYGNINFYQGLDTSTTPQYALRSRNFLNPTTLDFGGSAHVQFGDPKKRGLLDMLIGMANGQVIYATNTGTRTQPNWQIPDTAFLNTDFGNNSRPFFLKHNGKTGILVGNSYENTWNNTYHKYAFYLPDSSQSSGWRLQKNLSLAIDNPNNISPLVAADLDGNGYDDIVGIETAYYNDRVGTKMVFYRNCGNPHDSLCIKKDSIMCDSKVYYFRSIAFLDADSDGDLDMLALTGYYFESGQWAFFRNIGTRTQPRFKQELMPAVFQPILNEKGYLTFADVYGTGQKDAFFGMPKGGIIAYRNQNCSTAAPTPKNTGISCFSDIVDSIPTLRWSSMGVNKTYEVVVHYVGYNGELSAPLTYCTKDTFYKPQIDGSTAWIYRWSVRTNVTDSCGLCQSSWSEPRYFFMRPKISVYNNFCVNDTTRLSVYTLGGQYVRFQWFFNDQPLSSQPTLYNWDLTAKQAGRYRCRVVFIDASGTCDSIIVDTRELVLKHPSVSIQQISCDAPNRKAQFGMQISDFVSYYETKWFIVGQQTPHTRAYGTVNLNLTNIAVGTKVYCQSSFTCFSTFNLSTVNSDTLIVSCLTPTNDLANPIFSVSPNPASDFLNITFLGADTEGVLKTLSLHNTIGQSVLETTTTQNNWALDVSHLPNGVYVLQTTLQGKPQKAIQKIIIAK